MGGEGFEQWNFKQCRMEEQLPGIGPLSWTIGQAFLNKVLKTAQFVENQCYSCTQYFSFNKLSEVDLPMSEWLFVEFQL